MFDWFSWGALFTMIINVGIMIYFTMLICLLGKQNEAVLEKLKDLEETVIRQNS